MTAALMPRYRKANTFSIGATKRPVPRLGGGTVEAPTKAPPVHPTDGRSAARPVPPYPGTYTPGSVAYTPPPDGTPTTGGTPSRGVGGAAWSTASSTVALTVLPDKVHTSFCISFS